MSRRARRFFDVSRSLGIYDAEPGEWEMIEISKSPVAVVLNAPDTVETLSYPAPDHTRRRNENFE